MAIQPNELEFYQAVTANDTASNGGRRSYNKVVPGARENLFPQVLNAERVAGVTRKRKVFMKNSSIENLPLLASKMGLDKFTPAGDRVYLFAGTETDTQGDLTGNEDRYGCGYLTADVSVDDTQIQVTVEDPSTIIFRDTETLYLWDGTNEEEATISGAPSISGSVVTIDLAAPLNNGFLGGLTTGGSPKTYAASMLDSGDIQSSASAVTVTSSGGSYDDTTYPVEINEQGGISHTVTLTFTSATAFDAVSDVDGSLGSGNLSSDFAPLNTHNNMNVPYFTLRSAGFGGTFASGDTLVFSTTEGVIPAWLEQIVPAGIDALDSNSTELLIMGG